MRAPLPRRLAVLAAAALLVGACGSGGATSPPRGTSGPAASGGGGGDASTLNACSLLSTAEIQAAVGWPVQDGVLQDSDGQTDCEWQAQASDGGSVGLTVSNFDDALWQAGSSAPISTAVSGIGDAAYKGWPHAGDLAIKDGRYEVDVAIIDFQAPNAKLDAEDLVLAKLVLPRV